MPEQDAEYQSWSEEARYLFDERIGMTFGSLPIAQCDPDLVEECRTLARAYELLERKKRK